MKKGVAVKFAGPKSPILPRLEKRLIMYNPVIDAEMVKCDSPPQNVYDLLSNTEEGEEMIDYNKLWSRENFRDCAGRGNDTTDYSGYGTHTYPVMGASIKKVNTHGFQKFCQTFFFGKGNNFGYMARKCFGCSFPKIVLLKN